MSIEETKGDSSGILGVYSNSLCDNNSIIYPSYYFNTTNMTLLNQYLIKFIGNQLVISQNGNT